MLGWDGLFTHPALEVSFPLLELGRVREAKPPTSPKNPALSPIGSLIPALSPTFSLPEPQGGTPGVLTGLGSKPWESTGSQSISIS